MKDRYEFDDFVWDASVPALYYKGELIEDAGKRALQVLGVFLRQPNQLISHQQVLDDVWGGDNITVTPDNVHQTISQLRKLFRSRTPGVEYFKSKKGIGYTFIAEVREGHSLVNAGHHLSLTVSEPANPRRRSFMRIFPLLVLAACVIAAIAVLLWRPWDRSEAEIKHLITDSQSYESLVLYENPTAFKEEDLDKYWTSDIDSTANSDRTRIRSNVQGMIDRGEHYGPETKCDRLDFQWVKLNESGDFAAVRTLEKWSTTTYANDGRFVKNHTVGPYFVDYSVRKVGGRWLIDRSTTGRVVRPKPLVSGIETESKPRGGEPFLVKLSGSDFQPDAVYLEIFGPGCPDTNPCAVTNPSLRENAALSDHQLDNVKLLLNSGTFRIIVRNGDSSPSDPLTLTVP